MLAGVADRNFVCVAPRQLGEEILVHFRYTVGLRFRRRGISDIVEVCILFVGHSRSRSHASYPSYVTAYPRGSRSRVFISIGRRPGPLSARRSSNVDRS
jgi:hypothetical protein